MHVLASLFRRDLSDAERKAVDDLDEIRSKLLSKETEISLLHADINMLSADRDNKIVDVEGNTHDLKLDDISARS